MYPRRKLSNLLSSPSNNNNINHGTSNNTNISPSSSSSNNNNNNITTKLLNGNINAGTNTTANRSFASLLLLVFAALFVTVMSGVAWLMTDTNTRSVTEMMDAVSQVPIPILEQQQQQQLEEQEKNEELEIIPTSSENNNINNIPLDINPTTTTTTTTTRLLVCVYCTNPRTASIFKTQILQRYGAGVFDYVVESTQRNCRKKYPNSPIVGMLYQKAIVGIKQLDSLISTLDGFVIMGDEMCNTPTNINVKAHARQYFSQHYVDYLTLHPIENAFSTVYLPLGPRFEFQPVAYSDIPPSMSRQLIFNLIVSPTSIGRKKLVDQLQVAIKQNIYDSSRVFVHITPAFRTNVSASEGFIPPEQYRATMLNSIFTLCPAGKNPEAYRIFEAVESGSIPILALDDEYMNHPCKNAYAPFQDAPFIFIKSWSDLDEEIHKALPTIKTRQQEMLTWYRKFWTGVSMSWECLIYERYKGRRTTANNNNDDVVITSSYPEPSCGDEDEDSSSSSAATSNSNNNKLNTNNNNNNKVIVKPTLKKSTSSDVLSTPLITGCGRTGTLSLADFLTDNGIPSVHERMEKGTVSVSWLYAFPNMDLYPFESSRDVKYRKLMKTKIEKANVPLFSPVIQIVRNPLKVISSTRRCFCGRGTRSTNLGERSDKKSWLFVEKTLGPSIMDPSLPLDSIKRSMIYWYYWNIQILELVRMTTTSTSTDDNTDLFFRIEDLNPRDLVLKLGFSSSIAQNFPERVPRDRSSLRHVSPLDEKEKLPDVTWKDLYEEDDELANKIFDLAKKFGYIVDSNDNNNLKSWLDGQQQQHAPQLNQQQQQPQEEQEEDGNK
jgi:hypothetical protein